MGVGVVWVAVGLGVGEDVPWRVGVGVKVGMGEETLVGVGVGVGLSPPQAVMSATNRSNPLKARISFFNHFMLAILPRIQR